MRRKPCASIRCSTAWRMPLKLSVWMLGMPGTSREMASMGSGLEAGAELLHLSLADPMSQVGCQDQPVQAGGIDQVVQRELTAAYLAADKDSAN